MKRLATAAAVFFLTVLGPVFAVDHNWLTDANENWNNGGNWTNGVPNFEGETANLTLDITGNRVVTISFLSATIGVLNIGDTNGSNTYTLTNSGGATLTFDNGGFNAQINQTSTSAGDLIDENIQLEGSLDITNASANTLSFSGSIQSSATSGTQFISFYSGNESLMADISNGDSGGTIAVGKTGSGVLTLSGSNTYTGGTNVSAGTLALGASVNGAPVGTGTLTLSGGSTLRSSGAGPLGARTLQNAISLSGNITLGNAVNNGTLTFDGTGLAHGVTLTGNTTLTTASIVVIPDVISGAFSLTKEGASLLTLSGANLYSGGTFINAGTLRFSNSSALGTGNVTIGTSGGTSAGLEWTGGTATISNNITVASGAAGTLFLGAVAGTPTYSGSITLNGNLSLESAAGGVILSGTITGMGGLTMISPATFTISGTNTFSGGTMMNTAGATLIANGDGTLGTGNVSLSEGTITLTLQNGVMQTYIASTATLSYVSGDTINLNYTGTDTVMGLTVDGTQEAPGVYGASAINPDGVFAGTGTITVVPEPTTMAMMALGAGLLVGVQRFRRKLR